MIADLALAALAASLLSQVIFLFRRQPGLDPVSPWLLTAAGIFLLSITVRRSLAISFVAVTGVYESLVVLSAVTCLALAGIRFFRKRSSPKALLFGGTFMAIFFLSLSSSPLAPRDLKPPIPALQSGWLVLHVLFTFIGEAFFAIGFVAAILQLSTRKPENVREYDRLAYTSIAVGYPLFTAGALVFGAVWAEAAWGRWWSWDPKETWALVTWLSYTLYLHLRLVRKSESRILPALVVLGFLLALFTFFGVNYLLPGLHSYA